MSDLLSTIWDIFNFPFDIIGGFGYAIATIIIAILVPIIVIKAVYEFLMKNPPEDKNREI